MTKHKPTGWLERLSPEQYADDAWHTTRYQWATSFVEGKAVLDIACGIGYGTHELQRHGARTALGVDIDREAIAQCLESKRQCDSKQPVSFLIGDVTAVPLLSNSIDVIVSFETIEHIHNYEGCLAEFQRILACDGVAILSTPNALITQPTNGVPRNPFHQQEFTPDEFRQLLGYFFPQVSLIGQRYCRSVSAKGDEKDKAPLHRVVSILPLRWRRSLPLLLPQGVREWLLRQITGSHYIVRANEIEFSADELNCAPVLIAICRKHA